MKAKLGIKTETSKGRVAKPKALKPANRRKREMYEVNFIGKIVVEAEDKMVATRMAYETLTADGNGEFKINFITRRL